MIRNPYALALERLWQWTKDSLGWLWIIVVALYLSVSAGHAVYLNYQEQQQIVGLQRQLASVQLERARLQALVVYYNTGDYQELALRQNLLMAKPGETVYALPEGSSDSLSDEDEVVTASSVATPATPSGDPLWRQWLNYLAKGEK